jgi:Mn-dependent DtxR family transcriptional regulator
MRKAHTVLWYVNRYPELTRTELVAKLKKDYTGVAPLVESLIAAGFLVANPRKPVQLTEDGETFLRLAAKLP